MTRLALLRHGHTSWNREGRLQGCTDIPLDDEARAALARLRLPEPWDGAALVSSPLERAVETATLVGGRAPRIAPALTEMYWGDWEGLKGADLAADPQSGFRHIEDWGWDYRPPGGESPGELRDRLRPWLLALAEDTVAVTHIGVMRIILALAHGWDFAGPPPFRIGRNRLFVVTLEGDSLIPDPSPARLTPRS